MYPFPTVFVFAVFYVVFYAVAQPRVAFPISAQIPPVAIANKNFSFTFFAGTFTSEFVISYVLEDAPTWLRLDNSTRTLSGLPSSRDVGNVRTTIRAHDVAGSLTLDVALIVVEQVLLESNEEVFVQVLDHVGSYSVPATLFLYPQEEFVLNFGPGVFSSVEAGLTRYYALSTGNTPLPAWVAFDANTVSFSGKAPSLLTPQSSPQTFGFILVGTQIPGFSESVLSFQISVTNHILAFLQPFQKLNVSAGSYVSIPSSLDLLRRDENPVNRSTLSQISSNQPAWLTLRETDLSFSGTSPKNLRDTSFNLTVADNQNNIVTTEIQMLVGSPSADSPTENDFKFTNATVGTWFAYQFDELYVTGAIYDAKFNPDSAGSWLTFTEKNTSLFGNVPPCLEGTTIDFSLTMQQNNHVVRIEQLTISVMGPENSANATNTIEGGRTSTYGPTRTSMNLPRESSRPWSPAKKKVIALAITFPILASIAGSILAYFLVKRCRKNKLRAILTTNTAPAMSVVSAQGSISYAGSEGIVVVAGSSSPSEALEAEHICPSPPPRVDLSWSVLSNPQEGFVSTECNQRADTPTTRSSWDVMLMEVNGSSISGVTHPEERSTSTNILAQCPKFASEHKQNTARRSSSIQAQTLEEVQSGRPPENYFVPVSMPKFGGRRTSGLGHGKSFGNSDANMHASLRPVPLSPLAERAFDRTELNVQPQLKRVSAPNTGVEAKGGLQQNISVEDQLSDKDIPLAISSRIPCSDKTERPPQDFQALRPDNETDSVWEDDDWQTQSSTPKSRNWQDEGRITGRHLFSTMASNGVSLTSQESTSSQTNSLRFI